jgi:hypothetical protein
VTVWLFNLDADVELAMGKGYAPSRAVLAAMEAPRSRLARELAGPRDSVVIEDASGARIVGTPSAEERGRAFCPTPRAIALFLRLGVEPEPPPSVDVLRRVNGRAFCAELGQNLVGSLFARTMEDAVEQLASAPPIGKQWRAKRAHGMAGRGQRPIVAGPVSDADRAYLRASIERDGGIQIEPEVDIVRELAMHGMLAPDGGLRVGRLLEQRCDATGQWLESRALDDDVPALRMEVERVATALHAAAYFGPFGIDAYEYRVGVELRLNPRSEINARYSMGFAASGLG